MKQVFRYLFFLAIYVTLLIVLYAPATESGTVEFLSCREINCSATLIQLLQTHDGTCAFYDVKDEQLLTELDDALIFEDNYDYRHTHLQKVSSKGLMHHKYCYFDNNLVLTGSWNPTTRGTNHNDNYILILQSKKVKQFYERIHRYLQERSFQFSPLYLTLSDSPIEIFACPQHECQQAIRKEIEQAKHSIHVLAFTFTDKDIAQDLLAAKKRGVDVQVIFEKTRLTRYSVHEILEQGNVTVLYDFNAYTMHEKFFLIDEEIFIGGSYNPTKGAYQRNDENLLIIKDSGVASSALVEFERIAGLIYKESRD